MTFQAAARIAIRALAANPLRAVLTALGVIIGVAAVVTALAIGTGARSSVQAQITALGTNLLTVFPGSQSAPGGIGQGQGSVQTLTAEDAEAIARLADVAAVSAELNLSGRVVAGGNNEATTISGVLPSYAEVRNWPVVEGRFLSDADARSRARVAVIGRTVGTTLFPGGEATGQTIRINGKSFNVIGVMTTKGAGFGGRDQDDVVFVPLATAQQRLFGTDYVGVINVKVAEANRLTTVQQEVEGLLRQRHRIASGETADFQVRNQADLIQTLAGVTTTITILLAAIAAVSLLVGGIGIMNIMLVSVTERTREIGIRKAIGATRRDILLQFLVEAMTLSVGGGLLGVLLALGTARLVTALAGWATTVTPAAVTLAFGFAAGVGVFFGLYPARRAAALDPIAALRYE